MTTPDSKDRVALLERAKTFARQKVKTAQIRIREEMEDEIAIWLADFAEAETEGLKARVEELETFLRSPKLTQCRYIEDGQMSEDIQKLLSPPTDALHQAREGQE